MGYENLLYEKTNNVAVVTLNRPHRLNALSRDLRQELIDLLAELRRDDEVRVLVIAGAPRPDGRPCFSAGADIRERNDRGANSASEHGFDSWDDALTTQLSAFGESREHHGSAFRIDVWSAVATFPSPTIAAIDGVCTAGGLELAIACDLRVAAETAQISDLHMLNLGLLGGSGLQSRLPKIIGLAKAKELLWTGEVIDGQEAWRIGLVNRVFPQGQLMEGTLRLANRIATMRPLGIKYSKLVLDASVDQGVQESMRFSAFADTLLRTRDLDQVGQVYKAFSDKSGK